MKLRIICVLLIVTCVFCGCKSNSKPVKLQLKSISFVADIKYNEISYSCDCTIHSNKNLSIVFKSPDNLKGLTVACNSGLCSISYNGLSIDSADNVLPENFFVSNFNDVLKMCDGSELIEQKHSLYVNGKLNGKEFKLTASPTGLPILLTIPDLCMRIDFNNVKVKNK